ncbi:N-terminal nucleophile aminohydrolases superfamily protein, partial [Prunus dulcis]
WHNHKYFEVASIKPSSSLSLLKNGQPPSRDCWRRLRAPMAARPMALEPPSSPLPFQTCSTLGPPGAGWKVMISDGCSPEFHRSSSSIFSFVSPPNHSSEAPEVQSSRRRDLRRVVDERRHPPPGHP